VTPIAALFAVALVLVSAAMHTYWNLLVKRSEDQAIFMWMMMCAAVVIFLPVALFLIFAEGAGVRNLIYPIAGGVVQGFYCLWLARAYNHGDFSLVYPLARGAAPALIAIAAWPLLNERLSVSGALGIAVVFLGVLVLHAEGLSADGMRAMSRALRSRASGLAALCAVSIAAYHVIDKAGVKDSNPFVYNYAIHPAICVVLGLLIQPWRRMDSVRREWRERKWQVIIVAVLCFGAYFLVLVAMTLWRVGYVATARNISIVFAVARWLREQHLSSRLAGAALILAGIGVLAVAG